MITKEDIQQAALNKVQQDQIRTMEFMDELYLKGHIPPSKHSKIKILSGSQFDWMIFLMCLGFAISFILGYLACLIRSL